MDQNLQPVSMNVDSNRPVMYVVAGIIIVCIGAAVYLLSPKAATMDLELPITATTSTSPTEQSADVTTPTATTTTEAATSTIPVTTKASSTPVAPKVPATPPPAALPPVSKSKYKNGTYTANGSYTSPGGPEQVTITITVKDDLIVDSQFQGSSIVGKSVRFMGIFSENYKPLIVGKNIDEVQLSKVSGSSLTSAGFNDALAKIRAQAVNS